MIIFIFLEHLLWKSVGGWAGVEGDFVSEGIWVEFWLKLELAASESSGDLLLLIKASISITINSHQITVPR
jgi:hypothetical protein